MQGRAAKATCSKSLSSKEIMYHVIYCEIRRDSRSARAGLEGFCAVGCAVGEIHALVIYD